MPMRYGVSRIRNLFSVPNVVYKTRDRGISLDQQSFVNRVRWCRLMSWYGLYFSQSLAELFRRGIEQLFGNRWLRGLGNWSRILRSNRIWPNSNRLLGFN